MDPALPCRANDFQGAHPGRSELILSAFLRFSRTYGLLFIEVSYCVLPPLKGDYYEIIVSNRRPTPHELFRLVVDSLTALRCSAEGAPAGGEVDGTSHHSRPVEQEVRQENSRESAVWITAQVGSIRESGSDSEYGKYFQQTDIERLHKVVAGIFSRSSEHSCKQGCGHHRLRGTCESSSGELFGPWRAGTRDPVRLVGNPAPGAGKTTHLAAPRPRNRGTRRALL